MIDSIKDLDSSSSEESNDEEWDEWRLKEGKSIKIYIIKPEEVKEAIILSSERIMSQVNELKHQGHKLLKEKKYLEAIVKYKEAMDKLPSSSLMCEDFLTVKEQIVANQIYCYYKLKDKSSVISQCEQWLKYFPSSSKLNYYYGLAKSQEDSFFKKLFFKYELPKSGKKKKQGCQALDLHPKSLILSLISALGLSLFTFILFNKVKRGF